MEDEGIINCESTGPFDVFNASFLIFAVIYALSLAFIKNMRLLTAEEYLRPPKKKTRKNYSRETAVLRKFRRLAKNPKRAYGALPPAQYWAFRRRIKKTTAVKTRVWREKVTEEFGKYFENPAIAYGELSPNDYRRFRRVINTPVVVKCHDIDDDRSQGRYRAFSKRDEQKFIRAAIRLAQRSFHGLASTKARQVRKKAKSLFFEVVKQHKARSLPLGRRSPASNSYVIRVENENKRLWKQLLAAVRKNAL